MCCTGLAAGTGENASNADSFQKNSSDKCIRIALCHLDLAQGPQEKNIQKIEKAIHVAGRHGANWIITPETALQGYYFYVINPKQKDKIEEQPSDAIRFLLDASSSYGAYLFLGAGEYDKKADCYRNSCLVFGPDGKLVGRHSKMTAHVGFGAEVWSTNDHKLNPVACSGEDYYRHRCLAACDRNRESAAKLGAGLTSSEPAGSRLQPDRQAQVDGHDAGSECSR